MQDIRTAILSRELRAYVAQKRMEQRMLAEMIMPSDSDNVKVYSFDTAKKFF